MNIVFFGTFDEGAHPRVRVLRQGLEQLGHDVTVVNVPLELDTSERLEMARRPWLMLGLVRQLLTTYVRLAQAARRVKTPPDAVVVGYLGLLDVHVARRMFSAPVILDHMAPLSGTLGDRRLSGWRMALAGRIDRAAERAADLVLVDTREHQTLVTQAGGADTMVVPVGAPSEWFRQENSADSDLSIVFFGLYTPLQGIETLAQAIEATSDLDVRWTLIGSGQDRALMDRVVGHRDDVETIDWVNPEALPGIVAQHSVCLGIFGSTPKALRVVPNKVFQGAAAGCVVITSDTECQRRALGTVAEYVAAGDAVALENAIRRLADRRELLPGLQGATAAHAAERFAPTSVVAPLDAWIRSERTGEQPADH